MKVERARIRSTSPRRRRVRVRRAPDRELSHARLRPQEPPPARRRDPSAPRLVVAAVLTAALHLLPVLLDPGLDLRDAGVPPTARAPLLLASGAPPLSAALRVIPAREWDALVRGRPRAARAEPELARVRPPERRPEVEKTKPPPEVARTKPREPPPELARTEPEPPPEPARTEPEPPPELARSMPPPPLSPPPRSPPSGPPAELAGADRPGADPAAALAEVIAREAERMRDGDADRERRARRTLAPVDPLVLSMARAPLEYTEGEASGGARSGDVAGSGDASRGERAPPPAPGSGPGGSSAPAGVKVRERGGGLDVQEGASGRSHRRAGLRRPGRGSGDGRPLGPAPAVAGQGGGGSEVRRGVSGGAEDGSHLEGQAGGPGSSTGGELLVDLPLDPHRVGYLEKVKSRFYGRFVRPGVDGTLRVVLDFVIAGDGRAEALRLVEGSGRTELDRSVIRAVAESWFPAPSEAFGVNRLPLRFIVTHRGSGAGAAPR